MNRVVWKFPMRQPVVDLDLPESAQIIDVRNQGDLPTLWVLLDLDAPTVKRTFVGRETGEPIGGNLDYVGSAHDVSGWLVYHIFERDRSMRQVHPL